MNRMPSRTPPVPDHREVARLAALRALCLLDTPADPQLDLVTRIAGNAFAVPIAAVSLIDEARLWFKSKVGLAVSSTPRDIAFCAHAIHGTEPLVVLDARLDARFADNPLVTGAPHIRFYAGMPLIDRAGHALGTLCVIDSEARTRFGDTEIALLRSFAKLVCERIETLRTIGYVDRLTWLPNRTSFIDDVESWRAGASVATDDLTTIAVDVCGVGYFHDMMRALGCETAEGYLLAARDRLVAAVAPGPVYRIGETLFGLIVDQRRRSLDATLGAIAAAFERPLEHAGIPYTAALSIGAVHLREIDDPADTLRALITAADMARTGGTGFSVYERSHDDTQRRAFLILAALPRALQVDDQLSLVYQPRVNLTSGKCVGVEALLRWNHPAMGPIAPSDFIPLAERTALMSRVTQWVLRSAFAEASRWQRDGHDFIVSVNVSATDLDRVDFVDALCDAVQRHRLDASRLEIEFTESALSVRPERLDAHLTRIRSMGLRIAIDDFGTGYSNFAYLKRIPATSLKVDQSFVRTLMSDERDGTIVPSMIALGHQLKHRIVAEGIESQAIYQQLLRWGCDEGQGNWIARPMSAGDLEDWLAARRALPRRSHRARRIARLTQTRKIEASYVCR